MAQRHNTAMAAMRAIGATIRAVPVIRAFRAHCHSESSMAHRPHFASSATSAPNAVK
jgi:hypothetical protein